MTQLEFYETGKKEDIIITVYYNIYSNMIQLNLTKMKSKQVVCQLVLCIADIKFIYPVEYL